MALVKNMKKFRQPLLFDGLQNGKIYGTDIDSCIELYDKYLFLFEVKSKGTALPVGQSLAMMRIVDAWGSTGRVGQFVHVTHTIKDSNEPVLLKDCIVEKVYMNGKWNDIDKKTTVSEYLRFLGKYLDIEPFKSL